MKKALISGITGQDGSYLSEILLEKGYGARRIDTGVTNVDDVVNQLRDRFNIDVLELTNTSALNFGHCMPWRSACLRNCSNWPRNQSANETRRSSASMS